MSRYLITGGLGFIGAALANTLAAKGHSVRVLDNLTGGRRDALSTDCEVIIGDVNDAALVGEAMSGMEGCFHLGMSNECASQENDDITCNNLPDQRLVRGPRLRPPVPPAGGLCLIVGDLR